MALTDAQLSLVADLKNLTGDDLDGLNLDDDALYQIYQAQGSANAAAAEVWRRKAVGYSGLIDVTEGSSTRKLTQLSTQALAMYKVFAGAAADEITSPNRGTVSRAIERP